MKTDTINKCIKNEELLLCKLNLSSKFIKFISQIVKMSLLYLTDK